MKPNYKNWVPKGMVVSFLTAAVIVGLLLALVLATEIITGTAKIVTAVILAVGFVLLLVFSCFFVNLYESFSYDGK